MLITWVWFHLRILYWKQHYADLGVTKQGTLLKSSAESVLSWEGCGSPIAEGPLVLWSSADSLATGPCLLPQELAATLELTLIRFPWCPAAAKWKPLPFLQPFFQLCTWMPDLSSISWNPRQLVSPEGIKRHSFSTYLLLEASTACETINTFPSPRGGSWGGGGIHPHTSLFLSLPHCLECPWQKVCGLQSGRRQEAQSVWQGADGCRGWRLSRLPCPGWSCPGKFTDIEQPGYWKSRLPGLPTRLSPTAIRPPRKPGFSSSTRNLLTFCSTAFDDSVSYRRKLQLLNLARVASCALLITECSCHMTLQSFLKGWYLQPCSLDCPGVQGYSFPPGFLGPSLIPFPPTPLLFTLQDPSTISLPLEVFSKPVWEDGGSLPRVPLALNWYI